MQRISLFLSKKQLAALKQLSKRTGLPYGELIRRAIDQFLRGEKKP
jgi:predicted DNA binding CopG/RHH family protein